MLVIAHRGASAREPENTAAAFRTAVATGADGIELDLQLTRDGVVVVWHDRCLDRLGLPGTRVGHCEWSALAALDAGHWWAGQPSPHRLLRLESVLESWGHQVTLYLEIKRYAGPAHQRRLARQVVELLRSRGLSRQVQVLSFDAGTLGAVQRAAPEIGLVKNAKWPRGLRAACRTPVAYAAVGVDVDRFKAGDTAPAHRAGLPVYAFTCDTPSQFRHARRLGVSALITNQPAHALETVAPGPDD